MSEFQAFVDSIKLGNFESFVQLYKPEYLNKKDKQSWCAIHYACQFGHKEVLEKLISWNCDINQMGGRNGLLPIQLACSEGQTDIVALLTQAECDIEIKCLENSLMKCPNEKIVDILKGRKFLLACKKGDLETVRSMLTDVNVEYCDKDNRRPIHWAVEGGHTEIVKLLLAHNCDIDALDKANQAPEDIARNNRNDELIKVLDEERSERPLRRLISSMGVTCKGDTCDHKFCPTSIRGKTFQTGEKIASGKVKVYRIKGSGTDRMFVLKGVPSADNKYLERNIIQFLDLLNHERIIKYYGVIESGKNLYIVMDYAVNKSLEDKIKADPKHVNLNATRYSKQVLEGLEHLHKNGIIHRDLKPGNILLDGEDNVKLADFEFSRVLKGPEGEPVEAYTYCGTPYYLPPEIERNLHQGGTGNTEGYTYPADIWSFGVTLIYMLSDFDTVKQVQNGKISEILANEKLKDISNDMKAVITKTLKEDPTKRPSATALLQLDIFS